MQELNLPDLINKYGFPIIAAGGMGYFIFYIWKWATEVISPVLGEANGVLIALIDRVRMLDNDLIRLNQKLNVVLMLRDKKNGLELDSPAPVKKEEKKINTFD